MTTAAWHQNLSFELDLDKLTMRDLLEALDEGILGELFEMFGVDSSAMPTPERIKVALWLVVRAARQERPETTLDEVKDLPWRVVLDAVDSTVAAIESDG